MSKDQSAFDVHQQICSVDERQQMKIENRHKNLFDGYRTAWNREAKTKPSRAQKINHTKKINVVNGWGYIDVVSALNI